MTRVPPPTIRMILPQCRNCGAFHFRVTKTTYRKLSRTSTEKVQYAYCRRCKKPHKLIWEFHTVGNSPAAESVALNQMKQTTGAQ
jgi:hypothetical protein